jgi:hypothetical protein
MCIHLLRYYKFGEKKSFNYCNEELIKYYLDRNNVQELYEFVVHSYENTTYRLNDILAQEVLKKYKDSSDHKYLMLLQYTSERDVFYETLREMKTLNTYWKFQFMLIVLQKGFVVQSELFLQTLVNALVNNNVIINTQWISQKTILCVLQSLPQVDSMIPNRKYRIAMRDIDINTFPGAKIATREGRYFLF